MTQTTRKHAGKASRNPIARAWGARPMAAKVFTNRKRSPRRGRWPDHADWADI